MFPPETRVLMADGSLRRIDAVKQGDLVLTHLGESRAVLGIETKETQKKVLRFRPGKRGWIVAGDETRWIWNGPKGGVSAPVSDTGNRHEIVGMGVVSPLSTANLVFCKLIDCAYAKKTGKRLLYRLDVEEEHSYAVATDDGGVACYARC